MEYLAARDSLNLLVGEFCFSYFSATDSKSLFFGDVYDLAYFKASDSLNCSVEGFSFVYLAAKDSLN